MPENQYKDDRTDHPIQEPLILTKEQKESAQRNSTLFDRYKVYNRVPAREWRPGRSKNDPNGILMGFGPVSALWYYVFGKNNESQQLVDEANKIVENYRGQYTDQEINDAYAYLAHEDAKDLYLGLKQRTGLISPSEYRPTQSKDKKAKYYKFLHQDGKYWDNSSVIQDLLYEPLYTKKHYIDPVLNEFTAQSAIDPKKGQYVSIYDTWDYNTAVTGGGSDNIGKHVGGKPFEIYDRIYLDDLYGVSSAPKKGEFYGGYLPELEVFGGINNSSVKKSNFKEGGQIGRIDNSIEMIGLNSTIGFHKNGSGIHIKKKNRGKFTSYCNGKVTSECIAKGKKSKNPLTRKRATFAANARRWKHEKGGIIKGLKGIPGIEETPPSSLPYAETLRFIKNLENPKGKGINNGKATLYDKRTAGYGTDIASGHPELANKIKSGNWTEKEARDQAVTDMRRHDSTLMKQLSEYTNRPDTVSVGPRLLMAQARYHYGNLRKSFPEWAKAVASGDANKQKELALKLAEGYPDRYQKIQSFNIYE